VFILYSKLSKHDVMQPTSQCQTPNHNKRQHHGHYHVLVTMVSSVQPL